MRLVVQTSGTIGNVTSHCIAMKSVVYIIVDSIEGSNPSLTAIFKETDLMVGFFVFGCAIFLRYPPCVRCYLVMSFVPL